jgi:hypothetical protein
MVIANIDYFTDKQLPKNKIRSILKLFIQMINRRDNQYLLEPPEGKTRNCYTPALFPAKQKSGISPELS